MSKEILYTQEQLEIALLKQKNDDFHETMKEIKQEIKSQFHWLMSSISVLYISLIGTLVTALAKSLHWF
jgi:hypothetical protein